jgi:prolyl oligopeptidase
LAYEIKQGGEHSSAIFIIDVNLGTILPDHLDRGLQRGFAFSDANDGFYYCHERMDAPEISRIDHEVRFHLFGMCAENDVVLLTLPRDQSSKLVLKSQGKMLGATFCHQKAGVSVVDFYGARQCPCPDWHRICEDTPAPFGPFFYRERLLAHRFQDTPNGEIVELDAANGLPIRVIVPEWETQIQESAIATDRLYTSYLVGIETVIRIHSLDGEFLGSLHLEEGHTWRLLSGHTSETDEVFLERQSFTEKPTLFRYQNEAGFCIRWDLSPPPSPSASVVVRSLKYLSLDGTEVTMSVVGRADPQEPTDRPMIMTAYGGFGVTLTPQYSSFVSVMLELGFLFAIPRIRGGGEHGELWHEAARRRNRQVAFDDFISAADWLCAMRYTNPKQLAIFGGSNSGILVGAAITQRPDLFRAALCIAPLLDMVRYHLFDRARIWAAEYGTSDDPDDFAALLSYSPYHCIHEEADYPAVLFVCGDKDTRCNPAHARKMTARLQDRPSQRRAILLDHSEERGHSPTMPLQVRIDALTHRIAFLCHELGVAHTVGGSQ